MIARWWRWKRQEPAAHWREDARRSWVVGLAVAAPLLEWLGLR